MKGYFAVLHCLQFVINRSRIIHESLAYDRTRGLGQYLRTVKNVVHFIGFHLQIFGTIGVSAPCNEHNERDHHSVKQSERIENDCRYLVIFL